VVVLLLGGGWGVFVVLLPLGGGGGVGEKEREARQGGICWMRALTHSHHFVLHFTNVPGALNGTRTNQNLE
jgi:hypothetical protein